MAKQTRKYDWERLKQEYFTSEVKSVSGFFREKYGKKPSWWVLKNTTGWSTEKKEFREKSLEDAVEETKKDIRNSVRPQVKELTEKLNNIIKLVDLKIKATYDQAFEIVYDKKGRIVWQRDGKGDYITDEKGARVPLRELRNNVSGTDLKRIYDIIKTELGEPSTITNSRLSDSEGGKLDLPPITGITVKIVKNEHAKNKK